MFPDLYSIAVDTDASVRSLIMFGENGRSGCWNLQFIRDFHDWELEGVNDLMGLLYSRQIVESNKDCLFWKLESKWERPTIIIYTDGVDLF